jgi:dihydropteroate synthase
MNDKSTSFSRNFAFHCHGKVYKFSRPAVMGILNVTPDSFYDGGRFDESGKALSRAETMLKQGADIIDLGAMSTRPGAKEISEEEEIKRLLPVLRLLIRNFSETPVSVDTYRSAVVKACYEEGAAVVNDISGGRFDPGMVIFVGKHNIPYIMMHVHGTPESMQNHPLDSDVMDKITAFFAAQINEFRAAGATQLILDPGFGFGKTMQANYTILRRLGELGVFGYPLLVGISRKSMIGKVLNVTPEDALNGTTVLNTIALLNGADVIRVHDVKEATEVVSLLKQLHNLRF